VADYNLKRPCKNCPFRTDVPGYLTRARAQEIAESIANGAEFPCHETTVYDEETDDMREGPKSQNCAGSLIMQEHQEAPNQIMRIAERTGHYDAEKLDMSAPVAKSAFAFIDHHSSQEELDALEEQESCSVANFGCEAPAGYMVGNLAVPAEESGVTVTCEGCGQPVCDSCMDGQDLCPFCTEDRE